MTVPMPEASNPLAGRLREATPTDAIQKRPRVREGCQPTHSAGPLPFHADAQRISHKGLPTVPETGRRQNSQIRPHYPRVPQIT